MKGGRMDEGRIDGQVDPEQLNAGAVVRIVDELALGVKMADRAVVGRAGLSLGEAGACLIPQT